MTTIMKPVEEILAEVKPAYCDTWEGVFSHFRSTPHEWARVEALMAELTERGQEEPGALYRDEETEELYLGNGTHRFAATVELGLPTYPVTIDQKSEEIGDFYRMTEVELMFESKLSEEQADKFFDCATSSLSFRLSEDCWAEAGGFSSSNRTYSISFFAVPEEHLQELARQVLKRMSCCIELEDIAYFSVAQTTHYEPSFWLALKEN